MSFYVLIVVIVRVVAEGSMELVDLSYETF